MNIVKETFWYLKHNLGEQSLEWWKLLRKGENSQKRNQKLWNKEEINMVLGNHDYD